MKSIKIPFLILIISLLSLINTQEPVVKNIQLGHDQDEVIDGVSKHFLLQIQTKTPFFKVKTIPSDFDHPLYFFLSKEPNASYKGSDIKMFKGGINMATFPVLEGDSKYYLCVNSPIPNAKFHLSFTALETNEINIGEEINISTILQSEHIWKPKQADDMKKKLYFYTVVGNVKDIEMTGKVIYDQIEKTIDVTQLFKAGYGFVIDLAKDYPNGDHTKLTITVNLKDNLGTQTGLLTEIKFGIKEVKEQQDALYLYNEIIGYVDYTTTKNCYPIQPFEAENKNLIITIISYPQPIFVEILDGEGNEIETQPYEESDSSIFELEKKKNPRQICIEKTGDEYITYTSYSLQVFDKNTLESYQEFVAPISNGIQSKYVLPPGKTLNFRRRRFAVNEKSTELNLHPAVGDARLYAYKCKEFQCDLDSDKIEILEGKKEIYKGSDVNDNYHLIVPYDPKDPIENYYSSYKLLGVVVCKEKVRPCHFYFTMYTETEEVELIRMQKFKSIVTKLKNAVNGYSYTTFNENVNSLKFILHCYTGDAFIQVLKEHKLIEPEIEFIGNRKVLTYKAQPEKKLNLVDKYTITVNTETSSYFAVSVEPNIDKTPSDVYIESGELQLFVIKPSDKVKKYIFSNRLEQKIYPYMINFKSVNCKLKFGYEAEAMLDMPEDFQVQFEPSSEPSSEPSTKPEYYSYSIQVAEDSQAKIDDDFKCMFYASGIELDYIKDLVLSENIDYVIRAFKQDNHAMVYSYPFSYDNFLTQIFLDISYYKQGSVLKVTVLFEGSSFSPMIEYELNRGRKLIFRAEEFSDYCPKNDLCNMNIKISLGQNAKNLAYKINVKSSIAVPIYIQTQRYIKAIVDLNNIQHFYTDIYQDFEGEAMVTFNKGSGTVYARIIKKNDYEIGGWNDRVILPDWQLDQKLMLPFDYYNKRIQFSKEDTHKCDKGCELYIGVATETIPADPLKTKNIDEFSIVVRGIGINSYTDLNINDYGYGSIPDINGRDVYRIIIPFDTDKIRIHIKSDFAYVNVLKNGDAPTDPTKFDWQMLDPNGILTIEKSDSKLVGMESFKDQLFTLIVRVLDSVKLGSSAYAIKVSAVQLGMPLLTTLTSEQNEVCVFVKQDDACYLVRSVNSYEGMVDLGLYVESMDNSHNKFVVYANVVQANYYETSFTVNDIPKSGSCQYSSEKSPNKNFLSVVVDRKDSVYVVFSVEASQRGKAVILTATQRQIDNTTLNQNSNTLFNIGKTNLFGMQFNGGKKYLVNFVLLSGNGYIVTRDNQKIVFEDSVLLEVIDREKEYEINITTDDGIIFYANYYAISQDTPQLQELKFSKDNIIITDPIDFKDAFYFRMLCESRERLHVVINFKLSTYVIEGGVKGEELFDINAYFTDVDFINRARKDPLLKPPAQSAVKAQYDPLSRVGLIELQTESTPEINADVFQEQYVYLDIKPNEANKNKYLKLRLEISAVPTGVLNSIYSFPSNNYYYNTLDSQIKMNFLKFSRNSDKEKTMAIEFSSCLDESKINFAIRKYIDVDRITDPSNKFNETTIIKSQERKNGKVIVTVNVEDNDAIAFIAFSKEAIVDKTFTYVVKYKLVDSKTIDTGVSLSNSILNLSYSESDKKFISKWKPVKLNSITPDNIEYIYVVHPPLTTNPVINKNSICLIQSNAIKLGRRKIQTNDGKDMEMSDQMELVKKTFVQVSVVAFVDHADEEFMLAYDPAVIEIGKQSGGDEGGDGGGGSDEGGKDGNKKTFPTYAYYIIGGVGLLIIIGAVAFFVVRIIKKKRIEEETEAILGGPSMPLVDDK